jgi:hypothetical protein
LRRREKLKKYGIRLEKKSQLESKLFKMIKKYLYIPFMGHYLEHIVKTKKYINRIEKNFLGSSLDYNIYESYLYILLIIVNMPFRFFSTFKTASYRLHVNYYLR